MVVKPIQNAVLRFFLWIKKLFQSDIIHKEIVCLANSRKYSGFCLAGKEISTRKYSGFCLAGKEISTGQWVRPVSRQENGQLSKRQIRCQNNLLPQPLDVISVPLTTQAPHLYQKENYFIAERKKCIKNRILSFSELLNLCDDVPRLWINGYSSYKGVNDRIPLKPTDEKPESSLLLIKPESLSIRVEEGYNSEKKIRAAFIFKGVSYKLVITDPIFENKLVITDPIFEKKYISYKIGEYSIENKELFLCISLGEPYNGYCYKLVAGIICL